MIQRLSVSNCYWGHRLKMLRRAKGDGKVRAKIGGSIWLMWTEEREDGRCSWRKELSSTSFAVSDLWPRAYVRRRVVMKKFSSFVRMVVKSITEERATHQNALNLSLHRLRRNLHSNLLLHLPTTLLLLQLPRDSLSLQGRPLGRSSSQSLAIDEFEGPKSLE